MKWWLFIIKKYIYIGISRYSKYFLNYVLTLINRIIKTIKIHKDKENNLRKFVIQFSHRNWRIANNNNNDNKKQQISAEVLSNSGLLEDKKKLGYE